MPIQPPAVPITPPIYAALPDAQQPVFYYRAPYDSFERYCDDFADWYKREQSRAFRAEIEEIQTDLEELPDSPAARVQAAQLRVQMDDLKSKIERLPEPYTETEAMDAMAKMLGHVLVRVECGDESSTYPDDPTERVDWLRVFEAKALAELAHAIKLQAYRRSALKK